MRDFPEIVPGSLAELSVLHAAAEGDGRRCIVGALIVDEDGRVFVQRRSMDRRLFPGGWDIVGGHVEPGETLVQALTREVYEETGWRLGRIVEVIGVFDWEAPQNGDVLKRREFDFLIEVAGDLHDPRVQASEASEWRWVGRGDLDVLREHGGVYDTAILEVVRRALVARA